MKNLKILLLKNKKMYRILIYIKFLLNSESDFLKTIDYLEKHN